MKGRFVSEAAAGEDPEGSWKDGSNKLEVPRENGGVLGHTSAIQHKGHFPWG